MQENYEQLEKEMAVTYQCVPEAPPELKTKYAFVNGEIRMPGGCVHTYTLFTRKRTHHLV